MRLRTAYPTRSGLIQFVVTASYCLQPNCNEMCVWPRREQFLSVSLGAGSKIRSPFHLLLMSRIQCGDGATRTDAEDEEHKPFSHASPSSPYWPFSRRFWILPTHLRQVASGDARPLSLNPPTAFPPARRASPFIGRAPSTQHRPAPGSTRPTAALRRSAGSYQRRALESSPFVRAGS